LVDVIACYDGANISNTSCGFVDAGKSRYYLPRTCFTGFAQKKTLYFYVEIDIESGAAAVKMSADYPSPSDHISRTLIGRLAYNDGEYVLTQEHHGAICENYHLTLSVL